MKEWWQQLSLRDKRFLSSGILFLTLFLGYEIFFASISKVNEALRDTISQDKKLLMWMQNADAHIQSLNSLSKKNIEAKNPVALLNMLQKQLAASPFQKNVTNLAEAENHSVQLQLQKVSFDELITWLTALWQKEGVTVSQITIKPETPSGIVTAVILLS